MIRIGYSTAEKNKEIAHYCDKHKIKKVKILMPEKFPALKKCRKASSETVYWNHIIQYKYYYRLLQEIDEETLVVVNECLRTQKRSDLTYNCIRHFLNQAGHRIIFQYFPIIDTIEDFMILVDFDTGNRWRREKYSIKYVREIDLACSLSPVVWRELKVKCDERTHKAYAERKRLIISNLGLNDPHTIPRQLHLLSGKSKLNHISADMNLVGRNNRFKLPKMKTYREAEYRENYTIFEFCHNFIDFLDFLSLSRQKHITALVSDLKVDQWYFQRFKSWTRRIHHAATEISK